MELARVMRIAQLLTDALRPACERIEIAGSIRRLEPDVGDIEIVFQSKIGPIESAGTLFPLDGAMIEGAVNDLLESRVLKWDTKIKANGPRHKRLIHRVSGMAVDLFGATSKNWGYIMAIRTGPAEFSRALVSAPWAGGVRPIEIGFSEGVVYRNGESLTLPNETDFFQVLGVPWIPPEKRSLPELFRDRMRGTRA